jgi:tetratricopeptide (TPR) repeat protein
MKADSKNCPLLIELIIFNLFKEYGIELLDDSQKLSALIADYFPHDPKLKRLLIISIRENIPSQILNIITNEQSDFNITIQGIKYKLLDIFMENREYAEQILSIWTCVLFFLKFEENCDSENEVISRLIPDIVKLILPDTIDSMLKVINVESVVYFLSVGINVVDEVHYKNSIEYFEQALASNPNNVIVFGGLGLIYAKIINVKKAIEYFEKAIVIDPDCGDLFNINSLLGKLYESLNNKEKAIEYYEKAITINPNNDEVYNLLGDLYEESGNIIKAIEYYEKYIAINRNDDIAFCNLGFLCYKEGIIEKAIEYYEKAVAINPNEAIYYGNLAFMNNNEGNIAKAIENYEKAVVVDPNNDSVYDNLGDIYNDMGNKVKAIECYEKALEINPDNDSAYNNLRKAKNEITKIEKQRQEIELQIFNPSTSELVDVPEKNISKKGVDRVNFKDHLYMAFGPIAIIHGFFL